MNIVAGISLGSSKRNEAEVILDLDALLLMLSRQITLEGAVERIAFRLHIARRAIISPYLELAMDLDKPNQLELVRAGLAKRVRL